MRIAIVTETAPPNVNGVVTRLGHTIRELRALGDEVLVLAPSTAPSSWEGAIVVRAPSVRLPHYPELSVGLPHLGLHGALSKFRPDVVHAVNPVVLGAGTLVYARTLGAPIVASFHTHLPSYLRHYGLGAMEDLAWDLLRGIHNQAAVNLCVSGVIADDIRRRGFQRVEVGWRGGVDTALFHPGRASLRARRRLTHGRDRRPVVLYVGRISAEKNVGLLGPISACLPEAHFAVVGDGPELRPLKEAMKGRSASFLGYLRGPKLAAAMASADVLVFPSATETLGLVALEAMAAGTPVVAAAAGGLAEVVEDGRTGLLFPPDDAAAAAGSIRRLLEDRVECQLMRVRAWRFASGWTWEAAALDLRGRYLKAAGIAQPRAA
ncbi:MAG TPA: glycosyltransferase family 1 protein [Candidatus Dormibacteraeota bacterium]